MPFVFEKPLTAIDPDRGITLRSAGLPSHGVSTFIRNETYAQFKDSKSDIQFYFEYLLLAADLVDAEGNVRKHVRCFLFPPLTFCAFIASEIEQGNNIGRYETFPRLTRDIGLKPDNAIYIHRQKPFLSFVSALMNDGKLSREQGQFRAIMSDIKQGLPVIFRHEFGKALSCDVVDSKWPDPNKYYSQIKRDFRKTFENEPRRWSHFEIKGRSG